MNLKSTRLIPTAIKYNTPGLPAIIRFLNRISEKKYASKGSIDPNSAPVTILFLTGIAQNYKNERNIDELEQF